MMIWMVDASSSVYAIVSCLISSVTLMHAKIGPYKDQDVLATLQGVLASSRDELAFRRGAEGECVAKYTLNVT